jgi:hypothetical protein
MASAHLPFSPFENSLYCFKYPSIGPFHHPLRLRIVYGSEGDLHSDFKTEIQEHYAIKILGIVDCDVSGNAVATEDILAEELFDGCGAYVLSHPQNFKIWNVIKTL